MKLLHLANRCGTCAMWTSYEMGQGYCGLANEPDAPIGVSDMGSVKTRIDFGCGWHESKPPEPETEAAP